MKSVVAAFNQDNKALLRDYKPSDGPPFQALFSGSARHNVAIHNIHTADTQNINQAEPGCLLLPKRYLHS